MSELISNPFWFAWKLDDKIASRKKTKITRRSNENNNPVPSFSLKSFILRNTDVAVLLVRSANVMFAAGYDIIFLIMSKIASRFWIKKILAWYVLKEKVLWLIFNPSSGLKLPPTSSYIIRGPCCKLHQVGHFEQIFCNVFGKSVTSLVFLQGHKKYFKSMKEKIWYGL